MKTLNLVNLEKSDIKYKISQFPDGQQQIKIETNLLDKAAGIFPRIEYEHDYIHPLYYPYIIKSRLNNFKDLELICCAVASLKELGIKHIELYVPYFLGSRSDRKFEEGSNNYLKDVICPIINSLNFESVTVIDPHSDVLEACLNNFKKQIPLDLIKFGISNIYEQNPDPGKWYFKENLDKFILISPDAGANKKIFKLAEEIGYKGDVITCSKSRDNNGKLSKTNVPLHGEHMMKDLIIIDDICDGGRTFINIVKEIQEIIKYFKSSLNYPMPKIYLIVTHGVFSAGFEELNKYFDGIYCTNSYSDISDVTGNDLVKTNVKQLNVF